MWIQTYSGLRFSYTNPEPDMISLEDIAHSLAHICRYNGHCKPFYSVAQHSVLVAQYCPSGFERQGLLHDAAEAYIGDFPKPLKMFLGDNLKFLEHRIQGVIATRFGLTSIESPEVKVIDNRMLVTERAYMFNDQLEWQLVRGVKPLSLSEFFPWDSDLAKMTFLETAKNLGVK